MNSIRISGGNLKGKKVYFDFNDSLRPTSNKLREILFNWTHFELEQGFECLDPVSYTHLTLPTIYSV